MVGRAAIYTQCDSFDLFRWWWWGRLGLPPILSFSCNSSQHSYQFKVLRFFCYLSKHSLVRLVYTACCIQSCTDPNTWACIWCHSRSCPSVEAPRRTSPGHLLVQLLEFGPAGLTRHLLIWYPGHLLALLHQVLGLMRLVLGVDSGLQLLELLLQLGLNVL